MGHLLHHQGLALDEEMIQDERRRDREQDVEERQTQDAEHDRRA
jgi:hypothetical protein